MRLRHQRSRARLCCGCGSGVARGPIVRVFVLVFAAWGSVEPRAHADSHAPDAAAPNSADPGPGAPVARPPRETFVVNPFTNVKRVRALDYLETGLPAFVAERLSEHAPLRFVGAPTLLSPRGAALPAARWCVSGHFERRRDWKVAVSVEVASATRPADVVARAERVGVKDDAPRLAVEAAVAAFADVPGLAVPPLPVALTAPFSRDAYAFVLYGRGLAHELGLAGRARNDDKARELLGRSVVVDPRAPETRRLLGLLHLEAGRPGHARALWSYALDVRPTYALALRSLAALERAQSGPAARDLYSKLLQLDPDDLEARRAYGELLSDAGLLVEAQLELEKVVAARPSDVRARRALALVLASRRAGVELVVELEALVRLEPDNVDARMDLGAAYLSMNRLVDAASAYEDVLHRRPRYAPALKLAADVWCLCGDLKKAASYYEKLHRMAPEDPRPVFLLAHAYYQAGAWDAAERLFEQGGQFPGMGAEAYSNLGAIALKRGHVKEALSLLARAVKRRPNVAHIRFNYALALRAAERHADALNELRLAEVSDPGDAGVRFVAGLAALRLGLLKDAQAEFAEAVRLDPKQDDARFNLALLAPLVQAQNEGPLSLIERQPGPLPKPAPPDAAGR